MLLEAKRYAWAASVGRWTMAHLTVDFRVTLCGKKIPAVLFDHRYGDQAVDGRGVCAECQRRAER